MSENDKVKMWQLAGRFSAVGIEMAAAIAIGTLGGRWLDQKFDTAPWLFWLGFVVGLGAAARAIIRVTQQGLANERNGPGNENQNKRKR